MTLKIRLIPTLLVKGPGLVKGKRFASDRRVGPVMPALRVYNRRDVDELIVVNVLGFEESPLDHLEQLIEIGTEAFVPLTFGGGIRKRSDASIVLRNGADKVAINSASFRHLNLISEIASDHGTQAVVASVDVAGNDESSWRCVSNSGSQVEKIDPITWAKRLEEAGAGEILLTSVERDGTMGGYDLELISAVTSAVRIPVIASGGAGEFAHFAQALRAGATAIAAGAIFHFTETTPFEIKRFLRSEGFPVRISVGVAGTT